MINKQDPFDEFLRPPPGESDHERAIRLQREEAARKVSAQIDESIKAERQLRKRRRIVRLLLLGQSESGKSTTLRQFQRLYTPTAFREERILWRAVIQLNIVRSVRTILDALAPSAQSSDPSYYSGSNPMSHRATLSDARSRSSSRVRRPIGGDEAPPIPGYGHSHEYVSTNNNVAHDFGRNGNMGVLGDSFNSENATFADLNTNPNNDPNNPNSYIPNSHTPNSHIPNSNAHASSSTHPHAIDYRSTADSPTFSSPPSPTNTPVEVIISRLMPLRHIEALLIAKLVPPTEDEATHLPDAGGSSNNNGSGSGNSSEWPSGTSIFNGLTTSLIPGGKEPFVRGSGWKRRGLGLVTKRRNSSSASENPDGDEPQEVLHACRRDIIALWADEGVRDVLRRKKIRLEEASGFFLNDLERVTSLRYMPTDADVLKARLKTVGVSEYRFELEASAGRESGAEWRIVDVGGARSQRPTWVPFFDEVDAIIFLAPISGFDQVLTEDRTVNRLEDSVLLWKAVCSNKLLANVDLVLFLNKCDLLEAKLQAGIRVSKYVRSYGDRENDLENVSKYLRGKFSAIHREYSPNPRKFYSFCTSVTDTATTAGIISSVRDMVVRQHLKQSRMI